MKIANAAGALVLLIVASIKSSEPSKVSDELEDVAVVKIGGSSITEKARLETLNSTAIRWFATTLASHISNRFRTFASCSATDSDSSLDRNTTCPTSSELAFVVVHGAGSFGHHHAKQFGLQGYTMASNSGSHDMHQLRNDASLTERQRNIMQGLARTRQSVQRLNALVVNELIENGISAVAISPCFGPIPTLPLSPPLVDEDVPTVRDIRHAVRTTLRAGILPVLHGDACLVTNSGPNGDDDAHEVAILSGDTLMEWIGTADWVSRAVFVTDVDGVYTQDPKSNPNARLVRDLVATRDEDGSLVTVVEEGQIDASGSEHEHDVTGGLQTKLSAATTIAVAGKTVTIARCGTATAEQAIRRHQPLDGGTTIHSR